MSGRRTAPGSAVRGRSKAMQLASENSTGAELPMSPAESESVEPPHLFEARQMRCPSRAPSAATIHALLAILCTAQVVFSSGQDTPFIVASRSTFAEVFLAPPVRRATPFSGFMYNMDDCVASVSQTIRTFFSMSDRGLDAFDDADLDSPVAYLYVVLYQLPPRELAVAAARPTTTEISANVTGPEQDWMTRLGVDVAGTTDRRQFFARLVTMRLVLPLTTIHRELDHFQLFTWRVELEYDFESRGGQIQVSLDALGSHGLRKTQRLLHAMHWELAVDMVLAVVAAAAMAIDSPHRAAADVRSGWHRLGMVAETLVLVGVGLDAAEQAEAMAWHSAARFHFITQLCIGLGCLLSWCRVMQHMEHSQAYAQILQTFRLGVPVVLRFVVSLLPLLIGFASLGVTLFSEYTAKFATLDASFFTLFAVMNGDVVLETIDSIRTAGLIGPVFIIIFVMLFIWVALSITISIIQDSYWAAKRGRRQAGMTKVGGGGGGAVQEPKARGESPTRQRAGSMDSVVALLTEIRDSQRRLEERVYRLESASAKLSP
eukprot:Hpha_TRINITY_DN20617_c0_g1::TRINITY_DN20617_c0_g1_i1::g.148134::m.148134/K04994/MCOLN3; mucolipin 3